METNNTHIPLTDEERQRYKRHIILRGVGEEGQERLRRGRVLIVGVGGLGSPVALYLAAAGVGTIGIMDGDSVDTSNLQRQIVHFTPDTGRPKVLSAAEKMRSLNPNVNVEPMHHLLTESNAIGTVSRYDFVVDCTDNLAVKYLVNDACVLAGRPFTHGSIQRFEGHIFTHLPGTACYRCLFPTPPPPGQMPDASQSGVLGAIAGMAGTIQAAEVLKYLTGTGRLLTDRLLSFDAAGMTFREIAIPHNDNCPICGKRPAITSLSYCG